MDPEAPRKIALSGLVTSLVGTAVGATIGIWSHEPWITLILRSTANSGIVGWTFFGTRELFVSPLLVRYLPWKEYERRRIALGLTAKLPGLESDPSRKSATPAASLGSSTWSELRRQSLLDSFIAAGITGGVLNGIRRGTRVIPASIISGSILGVTLQYLFNEASIQRLKYLSHKEVKNASAAPASSAIEVAATWKQLKKSWEGFWPKKLSEEEYAAKMAAQEKLLRERSGNNIVESREK